MKRKSNSARVTLDALFLLALLAFSLALAAPWALHATTPTTIGTLPTPVMANTNGAVVSPTNFATANNLMTNGAPITAATYATTAGTATNAIGTGGVAFGTAATNNASAFDTNGAAAAAQAYAIQRANQTGTQASSTITGLAPAATNSAAYLQPANNLSDLTNPAAARTNLGLGTAATNNTGAFDTNGAAATAYTNSLSYVNGATNSVNAAKINNTTIPSASSTALGNTPGSSNGLAGVSINNQFGLTQSSPGYQTYTGPYGGILCMAGDSRFGGPQGGGATVLSTSSLSAGYVNLIPARLAEMGFGENMNVINMGEGGAVLETGISYYYNNEITTQGTLTAGSNTVTITGSTTGLSAIMTGNGSTVSGPGIPYGMNATISGSTVTLHDYSGLNRTATLTTASGAATLIFGTSVNVSNNNPVSCGESFHQLSPAANTAVYTCTVTSGSPIITLNSGSWAPPVGSKVTSAHFSGTVTVLSNQSAVGGTQQITVSANATGSSSTEAVTVAPMGILVFWYGINDSTAPATYSSITSTSGSPTLSGFSLGTSTIIPGTQVTGTNIPAGATVVSNTSSTVTISANATASSSSNSLTFTLTASAWGAVYTTLINQALSDGWLVEVLTLPRAWTGTISGNETLREAFNSYILSTYGTETSPSVTGVQVCDVASLAMFNSFDQRIYADTGVHLSPLGYALVAVHLNDTLLTQYAYLTAGQGYPTALGQVQTVPWDDILLPTSKITFPGELAINPSLTNNYTRFTEGTGILRYNETGSWWLQGTSQIVQIPTTVTGYVSVVPQNVNATVSGSTSGSATFTESSAVGLKKEVIINCSSLVGTASWTFATAFSGTPVVMTTSGPAASVVTSISSTAVTVTGSTTSGPIFLEGQ